MYFVSVSPSICYLSICLSSYLLIIYCWFCSICVSCLYILFSIWCHQRSHSSYTSASIFPVFTTCLFNILCMSLFVSVYSKCVFNTFSFADYIILLWSLSLSLFPDYSLSVCLSVCLSLSLSLSSLSLSRSRVLSLSLSIPFTFFSLNPCSSCSLNHSHFLSLSQSLSFFSLNLSFSLNLFLFLSSFLSSSLFPISMWTTHMGKPIGLSVCLSHANPLYTAVKALNTQSLLYVRRILLYNYSYIHATTR